jgi:hypothetical protein
VDRNRALRRIFGSNDEGANKTAKEKPRADYRTQNRATPGVQQEPFDELVDGPVCILKAIPYPRGRRPKHRNDRRWPTTREDEQPQSNPHNERNENNGIDSLTPSIQRANFAWGHESIG